MRGRGRVDDKGVGQASLIISVLLSAKLQREGRNCGELRDRPAIAAPPRGSASPHDPPRCNGAPLRPHSAAAAPSCGRAHLAAAPSCISAPLPLRPRPAAAAPSCGRAQLRPRPAACPLRCGRNPLPLRPAGQGNSASLGQGGGCNGDTATWPYIPPLRPCTSPVLC